MIEFTVCDMRGDLSYDDCVLCRERWHRSRVRCSQTTIIARWAAGLGMYRYLCLRDMGIVGHGGIVHRACGPSWLDALTLAAPIVADWQKSWWALITVDCIPHGRIIGRGDWQDRTRGTAVKPLRSISEKLPKQQYRQGNVPDPELEVARPWLLERPRDYP